MYYENGEVVNSTAIYKQYIEKDDISGQRLSSCYIVDNYWCVTATSPAGNSYTTCTYEGSYIYCDEPEGLAPPTPDPPSGGGGGPSSPSGPDGLCQHPLIEGMYVDCNEVICSEGYVADENGNCILDSPCEGDPLFNMELADINSGKSSSRFGCVRNDLRYVCEGAKGIRNHDGIDLEADIGENVYSISGGTVWDVRHTDNSRGYGNHIVIETNEGYFMYAHLLNKPDFNIGDSIEKGQFIGFSGESDTIGKPHLHIEMRDNSGSGFYSSTPINIENYLDTKFDSNNNTIENEDCN